MAKPGSRQTPNSSVSKEKIVRAGIAVLLDNGLTNWTVDEIAKRAGCAKGLILYHFQSKTRLMQVVSEQVGSQHAAELDGSVKRAGADALDDLWDAMVKEVESGRFAMWLSLLADHQTTDSATIDTPIRQHLITAIAAALGIGPESQELQQVPAFVHGIQLQLLMRTPDRAALREQYDSFWLQALNAAGAG